MKNKVLKEIVDFAAKRLMQEYTYCGVAEGDDMAMLNSDDGNGNDIKIDITIKSENGEQNESKSEEK